MVTTALLPPSGSRRSLQAIARAEARRGKYGTAGQRAHAVPMQEPGQENLAARMLLVRSGRLADGRETLAGKAEAYVRLAPPRMARVSGEGWTSLSAPTKERRVGKWRSDTGRA